MGVAQVDALENGGHLSGRDLDTVAGRHREAEDSAFQSLDLGITLPSSLWRYTNSARCRC